MSGSGDGQVASPPAQPEPAPDCPPASAVTLSALVLLGSFAALFSIDIPILKFLRSHNLSALQSLGDLGEKLGNGGTLITISLLLLGVGYVLKRQAWMRVALDSLLAHGVVALVVNSLKHIIGRPRPRLTHSGGWHWWPSLESGLDSFPSGHTSATVAVATVLARALPRLRWVPFALAAWVGASRIWRGSHFPGDVVGGMALGFVVGSVCNGQLRWWKQSFAQAVVRIAPIVLLLTGFCWVLTHRVVDLMVDRVLMVVGLLLMGGGWLLRMGWGRNAVSASPVVWGAVSTALLCVGLGVVTGAPVVIGLTAVLGLAQWTAATDVPASESAAEPSRRANGVYALEMLAAVVVIQLLKGLVPLQ